MLLLRLAITALCATAGRVLPLSSQLSVVQVLWQVFPKDPFNDYSDLFASPAQRYVSLYAGACSAMGTGGTCTPQKFSIWVIAIVMYANML